jgi:pyruvate formate-lyase activating enzyme-like uncharacterized protein
MKKIKSWLNESSYTPPLSPGCRMCAKGSKLVLLITGLCTVKCYYCPLSNKKIGNDRIFANEWELKNEEDTQKIMTEAKLIEATGAGITGGDPLIVWKRTKKYISLLKEKFGPKFHIHLYTTGLKNPHRIPDLISAGLDEIRFHPLPETWKNIHTSIVNTPIKKCMQTDVDTAIEIPSIPGMENDITTLTLWANEAGLKWINLNELEYSETNARILNNRGFTVKDDISAAVKGSQETAYKIMNNLSGKDLSIGIHYCSSSFKDGIQLKRRIINRAKNIAKDFETISNDGTIVKGIILSKKHSLLEIRKILRNQYKLDDRLFSINKHKNRMEIDVLVLEKIAKSLIKKGFECYMVEEYPTADELEVERVPLPI